jgi:hypothetical protein
VPGSRPLDEVPTPLTLNRLRTSPVWNRASRKLLARVSISRTRWASLPHGSGNEFSLEGEQWQNGVFTYSVLQGLKNGKPDRNGDGIVTVSELESYVIETVGSLTAGAQNPTVRHENLDYDFPVY